mmetsp:Transcript_37190/g.96345  ORF Transcript_37190/g.96345 Transcript_37190/m.96345 type:complete len:331 (+) Transcript_37190:1-993(+)
MRYAGKPSSFPRPVPSALRGGGRGRTAAGRAAREQRQQQRKREHHTQNTSIHDDDPRHRHQYHHHEDVDGEECYDIEKELREAACDVDCQQWFYDATASTGLSLDEDDTAYWLGDVDHRHAGEQPVEFTTATAVCSDIPEGIRTDNIASHPEQMVAAPDGHFEHDGPQSATTESSQLADTGGLDQCKGDFDAASAVPVNPHTQPGCEPVLCHFLLEEGMLTSSTITEHSRRKPGRSSVARHSVGFPAAENEAASLVCPAVQEDEQLPSRPMSARDLRWPRTLPSLPAVVPNAAGSSRSKWDAMEDDLSRCLEEEGEESGGLASLLPTSTL